MLPLIGGSMIVTLGATLIAVPIGMGTAIYIAEIAPRWAREHPQAAGRSAGGVPSVVLGFLGIWFFSNFIRQAIAICPPG